ncbi:hypothetical protein SSP35_08_00330 [Streptomyces sp. NBRC 110611]|uniref:hypothetical protein n=1 Tax=Streptomyces sp. NBRC 110611 TaxID=1621259 RepID=UPI0008583970|nr:hypothetical protein [Streptomyces sp. NBRC 110611]GAU68539.1 hypothetical protein SSP35_08_00330 [Streptomyces sp. NBRC 110611]
MPHTIRTIFESLLRLLLPARGRHRSPGGLLTGGCADAPTLVHTRVPVRQQELLRGEDTALIRPYVLTPEERRERRAQRQRRQALWLAVHGVDAGPRRIHGVEVTA